MARRFRPFPVIVLGLFAFAFFSLFSSAAPAKPKTAADIKWPKPSQSPGRVMFHPRYPIETAWDPALAAFRKTIGADSATGLAPVERRSGGKESTRRHSPESSPRPGSAERPLGTGRRSRRLPETADDHVGPGRTFRTASSFLGISLPARGRAGAVPLRAIDIVRIPVLPKKQLRLVLGRLRGQLRVLEDQGWPVAVWEIRDLPEPDDLDRWAKACFKAFRRPPILMLGWHLTAGRIRPAPERMKKFLEHWADKAHSIIITGEELNTQFYAPEDGGKALDFLDYWIGVIRTVSPKTFVWCRIDEQLKRKNRRNTTWLDHFLPLTDGVNYQIAFGPSDFAKDISKQFRELQARKKKLELQKKTGTAPAPVFVGGFTYGFPARPGLRSGADDRVRKMNERISALSRRLGLVGCVRFVGLLPAQPNNALFGRAIALQSGPSK